MKEAFLQSIREEYPNEEVTRLVFADWASENEPGLEEKLRKHIPICDKLRIYKSCMFGDGIIYGSAFDGGGENLWGDGLGYGTGDGNGNGYGRGYGPTTVVEGYVYGINYNNYKLKMPKLYQNQLIFLPSGCVFCGYVAEQIEPYVFKINKASMIIDRDLSWEWEEVASNKDSVGLTCRDYGTIRIGPQIFTSMDWEGDLP